MIRDRFHQRPGGGLPLVLAMAVWVVGSPSTADDSVAKSAALKSRVVKFFQAASAENWKTMHELYEPEARLCHTIDDLAKGWKADGNLKLVSWKVDRIQLEPSRGGTTETIECTEATYQVQEYAVVIMSLVFQRPDGQRETQSPVGIEWMLIDDQWYFYGDGD